MTAVRRTVIGLSPLERPDAGLVAALADAGVIAVLDLGRNSDVADHAIATLCRRHTKSFGVRVPAGVIAPRLPAQIDTIIVETVSSIADLGPRVAGRTVIAQVTNIDDARAAIAAGASGLIAKGCEAGGRVSDETTFVLVQRLVELAAATSTPVWAQGGIGIHTATACIAGGATGVVLDSQLALLRESTLPSDVQHAIGAMDGSETQLIANHRVYTRPDLPVAQMTNLDEGGVRALLGGDDLRRNILPLGQDAAFAKSLAQQFPTVRQLVRGIDSAIASHLATAAELRSLAPHAPLAQAHGMKYPIAQGPMSRVSDRARFAEAVAAGGGLPFLALTLMTGPEVRELLRETQALLGDRPWGVGILGFVPADVREQQLAVLREIPPPVALIAGGRPSQAHPLEAQGTSTYLHVPSPGLLELFLKDGARKFVFEGRECGGHVGPRSSFALWELQLERLLAHPDVAATSVLFAGGIHDARSAAMVAAMAAPLAARGAKVGVLMGTAYLFTHEAVEAGAIEPGFQREAVACDRTVLLETAPGHSTRCADTTFVKAFSDEKARLEAAGTPAQEVWAALEQLNLGRLRIAAKGLRRDGDVIGRVEDDVQLREGMYMIGQVAALRASTCSVAELHADVSKRGAQLVVEAAARADVPDEHTSGTDVAIIGIAAIFPGAPDTNAFWTNIVSGKNAVREVPPERWSAETYYDPAATGADAGKKTPCKWGGFLDDIAFDPLAYGIPPKSLSAIEPVQLLSLEIARRAIADAGYADKAFARDRTSVIFGAEAGTDLSSAYSFRALFPHYVGPLPQGLDDTLPTLSEDSFPGVLSNVIAGRIANRLDLGGVNYTVDAACAASLAAVDMAVKELVAGSSDMVLCGGADLHNSINDYLMFASVHALSPTGQCHTFDANADGIVLGEGVACVVLKRLADAERDGDRVYAVIKGVAGASDGKSLGLTAPRKDGQIRALERAYRQANVSPAEVGLVEAHGTGTVVGDRTELATLTEVYTRAGAEAGSCVLGSVKSQIGHTKCAAGMAGLIKAALSIHHGVLPPTLNIKKPNPAWKPETSPFVFLDQARPWPTNDRVAAVSAFGFGGTNFHAVLAAHRNDDATATEAWPAELLLFHGATQADAMQLASAVERGCGRERVRLRDLARTTCVSGSGPVQLAIVAESVDDLRNKLEAARTGKAERGVFLSGGSKTAVGKVAFLCPGQGSQRPGMLADLFVAFPRLHRLLELGAPWAKTLFPGAAFTRDERSAQQAAITDTRVAQPTLGIADLAVAELVQLLGVRPDMLAGHSYGELAALCIAGAMSEADLLALSQARGEHILEAAGADPGTMAAVAADASVVGPLIAGVDGVVIANLNSPSQCVLSGTTAAIEMALVLVGAAGLTARKFPVACAFHSAVVAGAKDALARRLHGMAISAPTLPVYSNVTAAPYAADADSVRELLAEQVAKPVRFADEVRAMYADGARIFIETGPGQVLTKLVGEILADKPHVAVACDTGEQSLRQLLRALAAIAVVGVPVDAQALFWDRDAEILDLGRDVAAKATSWLVNGHSARPLGAPKPVASVLTPMIAVSATTGQPAMTAVSPVIQATAPTSERDMVVIEYLRNMRAMITAQRDVMLGYLGATPQPMVDVEVIQVAPGASRVIDVVPVATAPVAAQATPAPAAPAPAKIDPMTLVISIVSERTGYPADTLGIDLDLEADLSIDSIKRIEIIGELAERLGLRAHKGDSDAMVEELAGKKTLRALVAWLTDKLGSSEAAAPIVASVAPAVPSETPVDFESAVTKPNIVIPPHVTKPARYTLSVVDVPLPLNGFSSYAGKHFAIAGVPGLAPLLEGEGATVHHLAAGEPVGKVDGFVHAALAGDPVEALRHLFERIREAIAGGAKTVMVATSLGGRWQHAGIAGVAGMLKTFAAEYPGVKVRTVDVEPGDDVAARLHAELHAHDDHVEIGYANGARATLQTVKSNGQGSLELGLQLTPESVVVVTGGARGITALAAVELARRFRCRIELVGRSSFPGAEDATLASLPDAAALRGFFAKRGLAPAEIEPTCTRILADREIRATLAAIEAAGAKVTYHAVDVRSPAFGQLIEEIYVRHGRIDGVIHGAGILEDKLVRDKTPESFDRVVGTKLGSALQLASHLRPDVGFVAWFASISGVYGNKGQVDYACANDALDKLARALQTRVTGRVVSIDWGPWAGAGMVSPALAREYTKRGIGLIDPTAGIDALLAELAGTGDAQVILTAAEPQALSRPRGEAQSASRDA